ncbi:MAG: ATP-grasp domain-containing protein, partial [Proteobacteria bacterium]
MNSSKSWLICVAAGKQQLSGIIAAKRLGFSIFALDGDENAVGFAHADKFEVVDIRDSIKTLETVVRSGIEPQGVVSFICEAGIMSAATIRDFFKLPGPSLSISRSLTNKGLQRRIWTERGIPCPKWTLIKDIRDATEALKEIGLPAIVKPVDSAGSRAVTKITEESQAISAVESALKASLSGIAIIESFIVGTEYSVESILSRGEATILAISQRKLINDVTATEIFTPDIPTSVTLKIESTVKLALRALEYEEGPAHTEIILDEKGDPFLVETAGRGGGFMVAEGIVKYGADYDL